MQYWREDIEYNIYISIEAKAMLSKHINFLNRVSINSSTKLKKNIKEYLIILKHYPYIGKKLNSDNSQLQIIYRKLVINRIYNLVYCVIDNNIYIEAILDSRQNNNYYLI